MRTVKWIAAAAMAAMLLPCGHLRAQSFRQAGTTFNAIRPVVIPSGKSYSIVVTEFFHHGQINPKGSNILVSARRQGLVPSRVLQLGPGDFCRLAFQVTPGQANYEILYGGQPPTENAPPWTCRHGLLLETRKYKHCNLNRLDSVREAFDSSEPFGADYVDGVHHSRNPFSLSAEPFLSRYSGDLRIASTGTYGFLTSSQDCSFLLIDGQQVVSAPGRHPRRARATPGMRKDVRLTAGLHPFQYHHAAAGPSAVMVAAWEVSPPSKKPRPVAIPSENFRTAAVGRLPAGHVVLETGRPIPEFAVTLDGDVPLPGNPTPLIGVLFRDNSPANLTLKAKVRWDFGDGQTSDKLHADHVYLRPGIYTVKFAVRRGSRTIEITNRVNVDRPAVTRKDLPRLEKSHTLDNYLPILDTYDPRTLDAASLQQLVLAYEAKALALQARAEEQGRSANAADENDRRPAARTPATETLAAARQYLVKAVEVGKVAFVGPSAARGTAAELHKLAKLVGPMARDRLGDSQSAFAVWQGAAAKIDAGPLQAECQVEAADVAVNDLLDVQAARTLLEDATRRLGNTTMGEAARNFHRVRGDYLASVGKGESAREAYCKAEQILGHGRQYIERTAWRGAHSRSTEEFIRQGQYDRAAAEIRSWQHGFPTEKIDGYLTLMYARYWAGRKMYAQAIAQAEQLQTVNADSPYIDQVLMLAAECAMRQGDAARALATLQGLVTEHPGSPLIPQVKKIIDRLEAGADTPGERPTPRRHVPQ